MPPPELFGTLRPWEQDQFLRMPEQLRRSFLENRFPLWWSMHGPGRRGRVPLDDHNLGDVLRRLDALPPPERRRFLRLPLSRELSELLAPRGTGLRPPPGRRDGSPFPPVRGRRPQTPVPELMKRMTPEQRKEFEKLASPPERLRFPRSLFPDELPPGAPGGRRRRP